MLVYRMPGDMRDKDGKLILKGSEATKYPKLKAHAKHHTRKHMREMIKMMDTGMSFTKSHNATMKKVGS